MLLLVISAHRLEYLAQQVIVHIEECSRAWGAAPAVIHYRSSSEGDDLTQLSEREWRCIDASRDDMPGAVVEAVTSGH